MKEIIIDEYSLKNPFKKSFFFDFLKNNPAKFLPAKILHTRLQFIVVDQK